MTTNIFEFRALTHCDKCGSANIEETTFNETHGHRYSCQDCRYVCWGGKLKNKEKNGKRPPCPTPADLGVEHCEVCGRNKEILGYSETLEVHHKDIDPTNNKRLNLWVLCTACHRLVHYQRTYRGDHHIAKWGDSLRSETDGNPDPSFPL